MHETPDARQSPKGDIMPIMPELPEPLDDRVLDLIRPICIKFLNDSNDDDCDYSDFFDDFTLIAHTSYLDLLTRIAIIRFDTHDELAHITAIIQYTDILPIAAIDPDPEIYSITLNADTYSSIIYDPHNSFQIST